MRKMKTFLLHLFSKETLFIAGAFITIFFLFDSFFEGKKVILLLCAVFLIIIYSVHHASKETRKSQTNIVEESNRLRNEYIEMRKGQLVISKNEKHKAKKASNDNDRFVLESNALDEARDGFFNQTSVPGPNGDSALKYPAEFASLDTDIKELKEFAKNAKEAGRDQLVIHVFQAFSSIWEFRKNAKHEFDKSPNTPLPEHTTEAFQSDPTILLDATLEIADEALLSQKENLLPAIEGALELAENIINDTATCCSDIAGFKVKLNQLKAALAYAQKQWALWFCAWYKTMKCLNNDAQSEASLKQLRDQFGEFMFPQAIFTAKVTETYDENALLESFAD